MAVEMFWARSIWSFSTVWSVQFHWSKTDRFGLGLVGNGYTGNISDRVSAMPEKQDNITSFTLFDWIRERCQIEIHTKRASLQFRFVFFSVVTKNNGCVRLVPSCWRFHFTNDYHCDHVFMQWNRLRGQWSISISLIHIIVPDYSLLKPRVGYFVELHWLHIQTFWTRGNNFMPQRMKYWQRSAARGCRGHNQIHGFNKIIKIIKRLQLR